MANRNSLTRNLRFFFKIYAREIRFLTVFCVLCLLINFLYFLADRTVIQDFILSSLTAKPSAALINLLSPLEDVTVEGNMLFSRFVSFSVVKGCEGAQGVFILVSALCAFRMGLKQKIMGTVLGAVFLYSLNLGRIVGVYYVMKYQKKVFEIAHVYVGQTFIILVGCMFFIFWVTKTTVRSDPERAH